MHLVHIEFLSFVQELQKEIKQIVVDESRAVVEFLIQQLNLSFVRPVRDGKLARVQKRSWHVTLPGYARNQSPLDPELDDDELDDGLDDLEPCSNAICPQDVLAAVGRFDNSVESAVVELKRYAKQKEKERWAKELEEDSSSDVDDDDHSGCSIDDQDSFDCDNGQTDDDDSCDDGEFDHSSSLRCSVSTASSSSSSAPRPFAAAVSSSSSFVPRPAAASPAPSVDTAAVAAKRQRAAAARDSPESIATACDALPLHRLLASRLQACLDVCRGQAHTSLLLEKRPRAPPKQHVLLSNGGVLPLQTFLARLTHNLIPRRAAQGRQKYIQDLTSLPDSAHQFFGAPSSNLPSAKKKLPAAEKKRRRERGASRM